MAIPDDIYLDAFQEEVWGEYRTYRNTISAENLMSRRREEVKGIFWRIFITFFDWFFNGITRFGMKKMADKKNYFQFEKESYELRTEPEIKREICRSISKLKRYEILTEEKFVRILTASIFQPKLVKKFVIPQNAVLYGIIAHQVFETGLENYCHD